MTGPESIPTPPESAAGPAATGNYAPSEDAAELVRLLDQYLADLQAGRAPDRDRLLAEHPQLAAQLEQCLSGIEFVHRTAQTADGTPVRLGDFRIVREIGRGGMGVVYEAEQVSLGRRVALKVLRLGAVTDPEAMQRFQREAETVARLHHTNIVPIFAVGCEQGVHYFAMQFIEGRSLAVVLEEAKAGLEPRELVHLGLQAAEALAHAHQRGVIHRDVKPSNLLLDGEGVLWLTDFGLAKRRDEVTLTVTGMLLGTPRYMSPEQAAATKHPVDHRTDVYSLGATLYELATGKPVFDADTPQALLQQIVTAEPVPPRQLRPKLARDLETILLTCLAKEPARRYQTAGALAGDLRAFLDDRPIKARRPTLLERSRRWLRANRRLATTVASTAVLTLVLLGLGLAWAAYGVTRDASCHLELHVNDRSASRQVPWMGEVFAPGTDEPLLPPFTVPTQAPVPLPVGQYRLRLLRPGWLSADYPLALREEVGSNQRFEIDFHEPSIPIPFFRPPESNRPVALKKNHQFDWPGRLDKDHLAFRRQHLWAKPVESVVGTFVLPAPEGGDVVVLSRDGEGACQRLEGKTGVPRWRKNLAEDTPLGRSWKLLLLPRRGLSECRLVEPAIDVDGDGTPDLIWTCWGTSTVLAMSGKTGDLLWCHTPLELAQAALDDRFPREGVTDCLVLPDVDGDGVPDLAAVAVVDRWTKQAWFWQALSGRTGKVLWRVSLPPVTGKTYPELRFGTTNGFVPSLVSLEGRAVLLGVADGQLFGVEARTGQPSWPGRALGLQTLQPPQFADLRGDGGTELLVLHQDSAGHLLLTALTVPEATVLWEREWPEVPVRLGLDWPLLADLDGDGRPEVIVRQALSHYGEEQLGVAVLDGATGRTRWQSWLGRAGRGSSEHGPPLRLLVGPDLDGDGRRELFVASVLHEPGLFKEESYFLYVDALGGADGRSLWWWRQRLGGARDSFSLRENPGRPLWWAVRTSGLPLLVVPCQGGQDRPTAYVLSTASGQLLHVIPQLGSARAADLDGDRRAELLVRTGESDPDIPGTLNPIRGDAPDDVRQAVEPVQPWPGGVIPDTVLEAPELKEDAPSRGPLPLIPGSKCSSRGTGTILGAHSIRQTSPRRMGPG
jgi:serine/threonine protein kinase/outer membrane protein assembly factor BamB